ncbi:hypothetical protein C8J57DRAFT_760255 [Mycena rebaudengoi]|nr:hypothetical protein C8J57DRAFT_760255 [Mycena rebaudengoi]
MMLFAACIPSRSFVHHVLVIGLSLLDNVSIHPFIHPHHTTTRYHYKNHDARDTTLPYHTAQHKRLNAPSFLLSVLHYRLWLHSVFMFFSFPPSYFPFVIT